MRSIIFCAFLMGCVSPGYRYVTVQPGAGADKASARRLDAFYPVPAALGKGSIRWRSLGLVDLRARGTSARIPALRLRMALSNAEGTVAWQLNASQQRALFPEAGAVGPLLTTVNQQSEANVEVKPGELRVVDFYFPLPAGEAGHGLPEIAEFDLSWSVQTGDNTMHETTVFQRANSESDGSASYYDGGGMYGGTYGPGWEPYWGAPIYFAPAVRVRQ